jgi:hypothetical protein
MAHVTRQARVTTTSSRQGTQLLLLLILGLHLVWLLLVLLVYLHAGVLLLLLLACPSSTPGRQQLGSCLLDCCHRALHQLTQPTTHTTHNAAHTVGSSSSSSSIHRHTVCAALQLLLLVSCDSLGP